MNVRKLCEMIDMPEKVICEAEKWNAEEYRKELEHFWIMLQDYTKWDAALLEVKKSIGEDKYGLKCLSFMLHTGLRTYQEYVKQGIPVQLYPRTMGCFSRFVKEHKESYGTYGFDREWWTVRQLALKIFRLGELEFEMAEEDGERFVYVHIPSDAKLERQKRMEAYRNARNFFMEYAPEYADARYCCESWLLAPNLSCLLSEGSNIISFQKDFIMDSFLPEDTEYLQWIFKNKKLSLEEVPQDTSLQRKTKEYLKSGGIIGAGRGHLKKEVFY